jgi:ribosomal subunit interface protein
MQLPVQTTFIHMQAPETLEAKIAEYVDKLDTRYKRLMSCRVTVEAPHKHNRKGKLYSVKVDITMPGGEIVATSESTRNKAHEDVYVALRDAFRAAERQLESLTERRRGRVKEHEVPPHGRVKSLFPERDYGLIETADGREVYFHRNSVFNGDFDSLGIDDEVRFAEEAGDDGPQASTVRIVGKHHIVG